MGQTTSHPQGADLDVCAYQANITSNRLYFNFGGEADRPQLGVQPFGDLLPVRIYSCDAICRKPSLDIFQLALRRAQLEPGQTMFVGDSLEADIEGANQAGMISVLKDPQGRHRHSRIQPRHRIRRLTELREILRQYNPE